MTLSKEQKSKCVVRTVKYRLYPTAVQKSMLFNLFNCTRFIWNETISRIQNGTYGIYEVQTGKNKGKFVPCIPSQTELIGSSTKLKSDYKFIKIPNDYIQGTLSNLHLAMKEFIKQTRGYPKFKSRKYDLGSITMKAGSRIRIKDNYIQIPTYQGSPYSKNDHSIRFKQHKTNYSIKQITNISIKKDNQNRDFITITGYTEPNITHNSSRTQVGIDFGLKELLISSDGITVPNSRFTKKYQDKLRIVQERFSRKVKGSKNRIKAKSKVQRVHDKIKNCRNHNNHCISRHLINIYDFIGLESLDIQSMQQNRQLSKAIQDVSWYQLLNNIKYKSTENQCTVIQIDKWYPSSKTCSRCGYIDSNLSLKDRIYHCPECKLSIDRDLNAAMNIFSEAKRLHAIQSIKNKSLLRNTQKD